MIRIGRVYRRVVAHNQDDEGKVERRIDIVARRLDLVKEEAHKDAVELVYPKRSGAQPRGHSA